MASFYNYSSYVFMICMVFLHVFLQLPDFCSSMGFSTQLIHVDSLNHHSQNSTNLLEESFRRSNSRLVQLKSAPIHNSKKSHMEATVSFGTGEYMMELSIGTPPVKRLLILDTGSDLTWIQCLPCQHCFKQDDKIFDPKKSKTFKSLQCTSCIMGNCSENKCPYEYSYGDHSSSSRGEVVSETYIVGETSIGNMRLGCGYDNFGKFETKASGILGLGGGSISFVGQLRKLLGGRFSYCLTSNKTSGASSVINFGSNADVSGSGVVSTPLIQKNDTTFYYLTLESFSVGKLQVPFEGKSEKTYKKPGNIIIDTGTTQTFLPPLVYDAFVAALKSEIDADTVMEYRLGIFSYLMCYKEETLVIPRIVIHFAGGVNLTMSKNNLFVKSGGLLCLAISPNNEFSILGNMAQMDYHIGYDLENKKISFMATDCSQERKSVSSGRVSSSLCLAVSIWMLLLLCIIF